MKFTFTAQDIENEVHKLYFEEDDLLFEAETIEGEGKQYITQGIATIEGERYHEFEIEFELIEEPQEETAKCIFQTEWDWYDYVC